MTPAEGGGEPSPSRDAPSREGAAPVVDPPRPPFFASLWARALRRPDAALAAWVLVVAAVTFATGFRAVSDDDYARVVIAQLFAHQPKLDPSGTSWLPLPFWLHGGVMLALGTSLWVARLTAVVLGVGAALVVRRAAWLFTGRADAALAGALVAATLPWSARLTVAPVPELGVAALSLFAIATLGPRGTPRLRLLGAAALFAACLARYEPWILAAVFAALSLIEARRARLDERPSAEIGAHLGAAALALAGPAGWMAHNARAHGSALHFLDRVAAYKQAVDGGDVVSRVVAYPLAVAQAEPELLVALVAAGIAWRRAEGDRASLAGYARPLTVVLVLVIALVGASVRGGAPTHHPERALFVVHLMLAVLVGQLFVEARERGGIAWRHVGALALGLAVTMPFLRSWYLYKEAFAPREEERAVGHAIARLVPPGERVIVETVDYGTYAVRAASGRPALVEAEGSVVPGRGGEPLVPSALAIRAKKRGATWAVGRTITREEDGMRANDEGMRLVETHGGWSLFRLEAKR